MQGQCQVYYLKEPLLASHGIEMFWQDNLVVLSRLDQMTNLETVLKYFLARFA